MAEQSTYNTDTRFPGLVARWLKTLDASSIWLSLIFWLFLWFFVVDVFNVDQSLLPNPTKVIQQVVWLWSNQVGAGGLLTHIAASFQRFLGGFLLAAGIGSVLGLWMGYSRRADMSVNPIFELVRYVPPIAWAPFSILWFGASYGAQVFVIFISALPPILINAHRAVRSIKPGLINAARMMGASTFTILAEVSLPASFPLLFSGLRIGVATGWMALVAAEIVAGDGSRSGLGYLVLIGQQTLRPETTIAAMLVIGLIGAAFDVGLKVLQRRIIRW
ncbi:MAG TPA: ABC transporter permease [Sneathiellales bacterium]|jgi:ABC-type nitrate/sulfonate/bicarbonate transport system permease component|nr:ABC transporter permease [Sneathiellales bacterium]